MPPLQITMTENNETESSTDGGTDDEETSEEVSAVDTIDHKLEFLSIDGFLW